MKSAAKKVILRTWEAGRQAASSETETDGELGHP